MMNNAYTSLEPLLEQAYKKGFYPWSTVHEISARDFYLKVDLSRINSRVTILDYAFHSRSGAVKLFNLLDAFMRAHKYGKCWGKIREEDRFVFNQNGFQVEAKVIDYFGEQKNALIMSRFYFDRYQPDQVDLSKLPARETPGDNSSLLPPGLHFRLAEMGDMDQLAALYRKVFVSYPYPVFDAVYLKSTLPESIYGLLYKGERLVAAAAADPSSQYGNAELTDFATLPSESGQGLASCILKHLEIELAKMKVKSLYTVARNRSPGMNRVFHNHNYRYTGTLVKNCHIAGGLEDMNVWSKSLYR